ncbi:MAG: hypothetical protein RBS80_23310 [Thermoguttaceae bacterium]|nr:hypothetical protein [Thermoguttaceae bacterium]
MMAVLALALFVGQLLTDMVESQWFAIVYWLAVLIVVGWVGLLAFADVLATKFHYDRIRHGYIVERAKLEAELRRIQSAQGNGHSSHDMGKTE